MRITNTDSPSVLRRRGFFLFMRLLLGCLASFLIFFSTCSAWSNEKTSALPSDTVLQQEALWKGYRLQLMTSPPQPYSLNPVDIIISAQKEALNTPFPGTITLSFEELSQKPTHLEETILGPEDFEEPGLAKIGHTFAQPGMYIVTATFTDTEGELSVLRGQIKVVPLSRFEKILTTISLWIISVIRRMGYWGIVLLMGIESACIPLPSEIIMPFSGYLVSTGRFTLIAAALAGALGCLLGSIPAYYVGKLGGRKLVERYGHWVLISHRDLALADKLFQKYGEIVIFVGRLLPVIRTFIAFPAGVARMNLPRFCFYTLVGSFIWCFVLTWLGKIFGENWQDLKPYFHRFSTVIALLLISGFLFYLYRHLKSLWNNRTEQVK
jgi:membrane protein DedA with SNARE-associated domain